MFCFSENFGPWFVFYALWRFEWPQTPLCLDSFRICFWCFYAGGNFQPSVCPTSPPHTAVLSSLLTTSHLGYHWLRVGMLITWLLHGNISHLYIFRIHWYFIDYTVLSLCGLVLVMSWDVVTTGVGSIGWESVRERIKKRERKWWRARQLTTLLPLFCFVLFGEWLLMVGNL